jgi:hypothetical protein
MASSPDKVSSAFFRIETRYKKIRGAFWMFKEFLSCRCVFQYNEHSGKLPGNRYTVARISFLPEF